MSPLSTYHEAGHPFRKRRSGGRDGFTLIEMMVGLVLGVIVLFALVTLFVNNSRMRGKSTRRPSRSRTAATRWTCSATTCISAGYYGDAVPQQGYTVATATHPERLRHRCGRPPVRRPLRPPCNGPCRYSVSPAAMRCRPACRRPRAGRRRARTFWSCGERAPCRPPAALTATKVYVQASGCKTKLEQHKDFVVDVGANAGTFVLNKRGCATAADIYEFQTRIYYVSNETIPTLRLLTISRHVVDQRAAGPGHRRPAVRVWTRQRRQRWRAGRFPQMPVHGRSVRRRRLGQHDGSSGQSSCPQPRDRRSATPIPRPTRWAPESLSARSTTTTNGMRTRP